jgi:hypothetical protein
MEGENLGEVVVRGRIMFKVGFKIRKLGLRVWFGFL